VKGSQADETQKRKEGAAEKADKASKQKKSG
jgi:hypothetical protein